MANVTAKNNSITPNRIYGDYLIMLIAPCVLAVWYYGFRSLAVIAVSIAAAVITEAVANLILEKRFYLKDIGGIFTGAAIALMQSTYIGTYLPYLLIVALFTGFATGAACAGVLRILKTVNISKK